MIKTLEFYDKPFKDKKISKKNYIYELLCSEEGWGIYLKQLKKQDWNCDVCDKSNIKWDEELFINRKNGDVSCMCVDCQAKEKMENYD